MKIKNEVWNIGYHYIALSGKEPAGPVCFLERFKMQLEFIKNNGYEVLALSKVVRRIKQNLSLPKKLVTLSFDDNLRDGYVVAFPLLKYHGLPATFFVITSIFFGKVPPVIKIQVLAEKLGGLVVQEILREKLAGSAYASLLDPTRYDMAGFKEGEKNQDNRRLYWVFCHVLPISLQVDLANEMFGEYLGADAEQELLANLFIQRHEMKEMLDEGMDIGSHTVNHPLFNTCGLSEISREAKQSREDLRNLFGRRETEIFAWPFGGSFSGKTKNVIAQYYEGAFNYANTSTMLPPPYDLFDIPRLNQSSVALFSHLTSTSIKK